LHLDGITGVDRSNAFMHYPNQSKSSPVALLYVK